MCGYEKKTQEKFTSHNKSGTPRVMPAVMKDFELTFTSRGRLHRFERPVVMGILNVPPDSFYDGGRHEAPADYISHARRLTAEGADIIDIGAASSRPGALLPPPEAEAERLGAAIRAVRADQPDAIISADTCTPLAVQAAAREGADIINDISGGLFSDEMFPLVASLQLPYVLMHNRALPAEMQQHTGYDDIIDDLARFFSERVDTLRRLGVKDIILDPGFGFAKSLDENYRLLDRLDELTTLFREPFLIGLSRKSMIYKSLGLTPDDALFGTVALNTLALERGGAILRVHDPLPARQSVALMERLTDSRTK